MSPARDPARLRGVDAARGLALFAVMGGGTLVLYQAGRALGIGVSRLGGIGVAGIAGFAAWSGLSLGWSITPDSS